MQTVLSNQAAESAAHKIEKLHKLIVTDSPKAPNAKELFNRANRLMEQAVEYGKLGMEAYTHQTSTISDELEQTLLGVIRRNLYKENRGRHSKFTEDQKREIVANKSVKVACSKAGISPPTFYKWKKELAR